MTRSSQNWRRKQVSRNSIRLAGFGGQGVITMGYVLANAASIHDKLHALMTQSYGPEARGGSCRSDVSISVNPIDYPKSDKVDTLVTLSNDSYNSFVSAVKEGGTVTGTIGQVKSLQECDNPSIDLSQTEFDQLQIDLYLSVKF